VDLNHCRGVIVAILPAFLPVDRLAQLVNIGTLLLLPSSAPVCGFCACATRSAQAVQDAVCSTGAYPGDCHGVYLMTNLPLITWR